ncbi:MAG: hypothetical protein OXH06_06380 [Gemmatimonadetes bacterium]|nr:hypothetical protein [Gemmatimonadota bacterium]MDE3257586.1 hypothetical protein [Gemmatimonadota bacterium]
MFEVGVGIALIVLAAAVHKYVDRQSKGGLPGKVEERLNARLDDLDRRLTDIQEIMIAIDEKLNRQDSGGAS